MEMRFDAEVTPCGMGSRLVLQGHDLSHVLRGFTLRSAIQEGTALELECADGMAGHVAGLLQLLTITGRLYVVMDAGGWPISIHASEPAARRACLVGDSFISLPFFEATHQLQQPDARVIEVEPR